MNITGRLTRNAEVRTTNGGKQVVNFSVAVNDSYKNKQAEWQRFLGEKAQKELEDEMDKMINSEFGTAPQ